MEDDGGIGQGDHFLPYKFIERTFERWAFKKKKNKCTLILKYVTAKMLIIFWAFHKS